MSLIEFLAALESKRHALQEVRFPPLGSRFPYDCILTFFLLRLLLDQTWDARQATLVRLSAEFNQLCLDVGSEVPVS